MSKKRLKTIFLGIGGESAIEAILRDFYKRMSEDVLIGYFFDNKDIKMIADKQKEFLMFAVGMSPTYTGKIPNQAHSALPPILKGHFDRRLTLLQETLKSHGLSDKDIRTWITFENAFRNVVQADDKPHP